MRAAGDDVLGLQFTGKSLLITAQTILRLRKRRKQSLRDIPACRDNQVPIDFRKGIDGLLGEAYGLGADPYSGDCIVFVKRDHTQLRALVGDSIGVYLVTRRFEGGRLWVLQRFAERPSGKPISTGELSLLLEGARFTVHKRARAWHPPKKASH